MSIQGVQRRDCGGMPHAVLRPHHSEPFLLGPAFGGNLPHWRATRDVGIPRPCNWHVACLSSRSWTGRRSRRRPRAFPRRPAESCSRPGARPMPATAPADGGRRRYAASARRRAMAPSSSSTSRPRWTSTDWRRAASPFVTGAPTTPSSRTTSCPSCAGWTCWRPSSARAARALHPDHGVRR